MRQYVLDRLVAIRAGTVPVSKLTKPRALKRAPRLIENPAQWLANKFIRSERAKDPQRCATWFDVHAAFVAGYEAAKIAEKLRAENLNNPEHP